MVQLFLALGEGEQAAFDAYADVYPDDTLLLVDTVDTLESGIPNAIATFERLRRAGHEPVGIRLDSGDLAYLAVQAAHELDKAGFPDTVIVLSSQLDELTIWQITTQIANEAARVGVDPDAVIGRLVFGVGSRLATSDGDPSLDGVFKLVAVDEGTGAWRPAMKRSDSPIKVLNPGPKRLWRVYDERGQATADVLSTADEAVAAGQQLHVHHHARPDVARTITASRVDELLAPVVDGGVIVAPGGAEGLADLAAVASRRIADIRGPRPRRPPPRPPPHLPRLDHRPPLHPQAGPAAGPVPLLTLLAPAQRDEGSGEPGAAATGPRRSGGQSAGTGEQPQHLVVGRRREVGVPLADGAERRRLQRADQLVGERADLGARVRRADRHGDDEPRRTRRAHGLHRGAHRGAGGQAVVDDDHRPPGQRRALTVPAESALALDKLAPGDLGAPLDLLGADAEVPDDLLVEHPQTAGRDGSDGQLVVVRGADLAHDQHIEVAPDPRRDGRGDRHAATGESEHERRRITVPDPGMDLLGQQASGLGAVAEAPQPHVDHANTWDLEPPNAHRASEEHVPPLRRRRR